MLWLFLALALAAEDDPTTGGADGFGGGGLGYGGGGVGYGRLGGGDWEPPPPPEVVPLTDRVDAHGLPLPQGARLRLGDRRWRGGKTAYAFAVHGDHLLAGGADGVVLFDTTTGAVVDRLSDHQANAVSFSPDGQPAWIEGLGLARVKLADGSQVQCWDTAPWGLGFTPAGEVVSVCDDALVIGPPGQGFRLRVPLSKPARLAISPDGSEVFTWPMLDPGAWQVRLDDGEVTRTWDERVRDAAYAPDGTLAVLLDDGVQIEGKLRRVKGLEHLSELAWSPDGEHLAVMSAQTVAVLSASGRVRCTMDLPVRVGGDLLWAGSLYVGDRELTSPIRIDPATCERRGSPYLGPPHTVLAVPGAWLTADSSRIALWDRDTGALLHTAGRSTAGHAVDALTLLPSGNLGVVDRDQGLVAELSLPELEVLHEEPHQWVTPEFVMLRLDGGGPILPTRPAVAASPGGAVAMGKDALEVTLHGRTTRYELTDQVHLDLEDPTDSWSYGGLGSSYGFGSSRSRREVSASWDPPSVRPDELSLVDLAWSADGTRLAMLWTFLVTDAYGDEDQQYWVGILEPGRNGLAGFNLGHAERIALSADGRWVAWQTDYRTEVMRVVDPYAADEETAHDEWLIEGAYGEDPYGEELDDGELPYGDEPVLDTGYEAALTEEPEPTTAEVPLAEEPEPASTDVESVRAEQIASSLLGASSSLESPFGTSGLGLGPSSWELDSTRLHHGLAQRLEQRDVFSPSLRGRLRDVALSADGSFVAVGTDIQTALWRTGEDEPIWKYDLDQGGTRALLFLDGALWVVGSDGTVLAFDLPD